MKINKLFLAAFVTLLSCLTVNAQGTSENINFADTKVKELCVANWDTNGDGELSMDEAAAVTDLGKVFYRKEITSFDELQYFTGLKSIGEEAFCLCLNLTSIVLPENIETIGQYAFQRCESLSGLVIPSNVQTIEYGAFIDCIKLESIVIPEKVKSIGARAFSYCEKLSNVTMGNAVTEIGDYAFYLCKMSEITLPNNLTTIGKEAFGVCTNLKAIDIPNSVTNLGEGVFAGCRSLMSVNIGKGVTNLSKRLFENCTALESITIPNSVTSIGTYAFYGCSGLTSITIPISVTSIGDWAFYGNNLTTVTVVSKTPITLSSDYALPGGYRATLYVPAGSKAAYEAAEYWKDFGEIVEYDVVENIVFADAKVKELCVANWDTNGDGELSKAEAAKVTDLGEVFKSNSTIKSFDELSYFTGLTSIGSSAFYNCSGLTSIELPNSVTSIGSWAFSSCEKLTSIELPNSVTSIGSWAFSYSNGLTSIEIPNSVTSIGSDAFFSCYGLTSVTIPNSVTSIGERAFNNCDKLTSIIVDSENKIYDSRNNCNAIIETASNKLIAGCKTTVIPNSVTSIGSEAFRSCDGLTLIEIPNSVTSIGSTAFSYCSGLTSIEIPNSVTSIGSEAFSSCEKLTSIIVDSENEVYDSRNNCNAIIETASNNLIAGCKTTVIPNSVTSIGRSAFYGCSGLTSIVIPNSVTSIGEGAFGWCSGLTSIEIPNSVTSIGRSAFYGCSGLTSIVIPNSVTSIGSTAFSNCSGLTSIEIPNSVTSIGIYAFSNCSKLTSVTVGNSTPVAITSDTFPNCANATLYVPAGSKAAYEAADYWKEFKEIVELAPTSVTITINQYGSGTYCSEHALDFTDMEGMKAYVGIGFNIKTSTLIMSQVRTVKPGVGLYIKGEPGEYKIPIIKESDENYINLMVGTLNKVTVNSLSDDGQYTNFKYTIKSGDAEPKFYVFSNNSSLSANKAYLQLPTKWLPGISTSKTINLAFEDEDITGIDEVATDRPEGMPVVYDLQGRRVINPGKGLYIVNGKKVLMK